MVVELPVRFKVSATDRDDFGSVDGLIQAFPHVKEVLFKEEGVDPFTRDPVARAIFRVSKP